MVLSSKTWNGIFDTQPLRNMLDHSASKEEFFSLPDHCFDYIFSVFVTCFTLTIFQQL